MNHSMSYHPQHYCQEGRKNVIADIADSSSSQIKFHKLVVEAATPEPTTILSSSMWHPKKQDQKSKTDDSSTRKSHHHHLGPYDILCGRTSTAFNNVGNKRFRVTIALNLPRYMAAPTRMAKSDVIRSVVRLMQHDLGGRFLKKTKGGDIIELNQKAAREKVGHALRDLALAQTKEEEEKALYHSLMENLYTLESSILPTKKAENHHQQENEEEEEEDDDQSLNPLPVSF